MLTDNGERTENRPTVYCLSPPSVGSGSIKTEAFDDPTPADSAVLNVSF